MLGVVADVRVEFPRGRREEEVEDKETLAAQCPPLGKCSGSLPMTWCPVSSTDLQDGHHCPHLQMKKLRLGGGEILLGSS